MTLTSIRQFFASPVFPEDEAKTLSAHIMNNMVVVTLLVTLISVFVAFITSEQKALALVVSLLFWGVQWLAFFAVQKGYVKAAAIAYVTLTWLGITILIIISGGMLSVISILYVGIIVLAALVINKRLAVGLTILTSITVLMVGVLAEYDILQTSSLQFTELTAWFVFPSGLIATLVPITAALNRLQTALEHSNQLLDEQHKMQAILRDSETRFAAVFNQALDGIAQLDDNVITMVNPAFANMLGYTTEALVGQHITEFVVPRDRELVLERTAARIRGEAIPDIYEITMLKGDSSEYPVEVSTGAIRYDDRVTIVAIIRGMSIRKQAQQNIQRLNVELQAQTARLSALNQIARTITTLTDLDTLLQKSLEEFQKIMRLDVFFVVLHDTETDMLNFPIVYDVGRLWQQEPEFMYKAGLTAQVIRTGEPLLINRTEAELAEQMHPSSFVGDASKVSASMLLAPLPIGDHIIGIISIQSYTLNAYDESHLALITGAAYQIAVAVENARLYEELRTELTERKQAEDSIRLLNRNLQQQTAYLTVLNQISQAVSTLTDLESVLRNTLKQFQTIMALDVFFVILHDENPPMLTFPIMYDSGKFWETSPLPAPLDEHSYTAQVIRERKPLLLNHNAEEIKIIRHPQTMVGNTERVSASIMMAPLFIGERILGTISVQSYTLNAYDENHLSLLQGAAYQIAIAVENARLYEELRKELAERKQAEEQVRRLNAELEKRVLERTKQLQAANDEMSAFTYSVSHDLRAPLRALNGFATIVAEELGDTATESITHYLERIKYNARRMGSLIDDLLALSRVGRTELHITTIDMQQLARQVIDELHHDTQPDSVTFIIGDLPACQGDKGLLKQVWVNLIDNAVKYSHKVAQPIIKIYAAEDKGKVVYIVKDNGSGFDMQYVDKLFGVFQRLHSAQEYEGTGVGLATTSRIITRHGGVIWAESELGNGATFYFSIGQPQ